MLRYLLLGVVFLAAPAVAIAADANIESAEITSLGSSTAGATTSYTIGLTPTGTFEAGDTITMLAQEYPSGSPDSSGFSFADTWVLTLDCDITGSVYQDGVGYQITYDSADSSRCLIGFDSITNSSVDGCYSFIFTTDETPGESSDFTSLDEPFEIGSGDCSADAGSGDDEASSFDLTATVFGENIGLSWEAVDGADNYTVWYSSVSASDARDLDSTTNGSQLVSSGTETTLENLDPQTTYYLFIDANQDGASEALDSTADVTVSTAKKISNQRANKPKLKKKSRKKKKLTVKWEAPEAVDYVEKYKLSVYKKKGKKWKKVKSYKKIKASKTKKVVKGLNPGTKYKVRMKVVYDTGDKTKWSKYSKVRSTKKKK